MPAASATSKTSSYSCARCSVASSDRYHCSLCPSSCSNVTRVTPWRSAALEIRISRRIGSQVPQHSTPAWRTRGTTRSVHGFPLVACGSLATEKAHPLGCHSVSCLIPIRRLDIPAKERFYYTPNLGGSGVISYLRRSGPGIAPGCVLFVTRRTYTPTRASDSFPSRAYG
jgi:hypothetical protein